MTKPNYLIEFQGEEFSCLGAQVIEILELIEVRPSIKHAIWYAADLDSSPIPEYIRNFGDLIPKKVGNTRDLIAICQHVTQFLSGVFSALTKDVGDHLDEEFETEDESFRDIGNAVLEIRAFDTTFLEVYANDYDLIRMIAEKFHVKIVTEDTATYLMSREVQIVSNVHPAKQVKRILSSAPIQQKDWDLYHHVKDNVLCTHDHFVLGDALSLY